MARIFHKEQSEITMDYVNLPDAKKDGVVTAAVPGRKLYRLVAVSFGLLCIIQVALNISLRLILYSSDGSYKNLTEKTDELKEKLTNFDQYFHQGWLYFHPSFYYISSVKKSWQGSRDDCLQRGADLMIINSKEEQNFTRKIQRRMWIGLTKRKSKGTWKWVDGTQLTESYWGFGEPNGFEGNNEDCAEANFYDTEYSWNDEPCEEEIFWICEKKVT